LSKIEFHNSDKLSRVCRIGRECDQHPAKSQNSTSAFAKVGAGSPPASRSLLSEDWTTLQRTFEVQGRSSPARGLKRGNNQGKMPPAPQEIDALLCVFQRIECIEKQAVEELFVTKGLFVDLLRFQNNPPQKRRRCVRGNLVKSPYVTK
jgi:hypothetical protein